MKIMNRPPLWLLTLLIMFPQVVETLYSPALPDISRAFNVSHERAAQTLSLYFIAFAVGVALWGGLSDRMGRRAAMISGLCCYGVGALMATVTTDFHILLLARMIAASGAAAGSVVVQTMLRDSYESVSLARVFSLMGAALALSPIIGMVSGGWIVSLWGHRGVFILLALLAALLLIITAVILPETRPVQARHPCMRQLAVTMLRDDSLWRNALLVALFNTMIFSYYSLAPFLFGSLGWGARAFGWTGLLLAFASLAGSMLNRRLLASGIGPEILVRYACHLALLSGLIAWALQHSVWILLPVIGVVLAYGMAIPNILSQALRHYRQQAGAAGALFGLTYYLLLGVMLGMAGLVQQLGLVFTACALASVLCSWLFSTGR